MIHGPDLPNNGTLGWFNSNPPNLQGRVGTAPNTATDVRTGEFVLSAGKSARAMALTVGYNDSVPGAAVQFGTNTFDLGVIPAPGAVALLDLAGLAGRRRRGATLSNQLHTSSRPRVYLAAGVVA